MQPLERFEISRSRLSYAAAILHTVDLDGLARIHARLVSPQGLLEGFSPVEQAKAEQWLAMIEAAQKRSINRTKRPIIAADIARYGENETVIVRREGGWVRTFRAHHKADTMATTGHIVNAMRTSTPSRNGVSSRSCWRAHTVTTLVV